MLKSLSLKPHNLESRNHDHTEEYKHWCCLELAIKTSVHKIDAAVLQPSYFP